jgi:hypothetical protein
MTVFKLNVALDSGKNNYTDDDRMGGIQLALSNIMGGGGDPVQQ